MPISETLDKMIDSFHDYGYKEYVNDDKKRNEIIKLYNMKENYKNQKKGEDGKIPTESEITYVIYYLRWNRILPF
tara:strand:- start:258 stop:482 length:225 start_codon:yes stop_codon:yes gene_type:complete